MDFIQWNHKNSIINLSLHIMWSTMDQVCIVWGGWNFWVTSGRKERDSFIHSFRIRSEDESFSHLDTNKNQSITSSSRLNGWLHVPYVEDGTCWREEIKICACLLRFHHSELSQTTECKSRGISKGTWLMIRIRKTGRNA